MLEFEVGCLGFYVLKYYCRLKFAYQEYYHQQKIVISSILTFAMTQMETILDHVVS